MPLPLRRISAGRNGEAGQGIGPSRGGRTRLGEPLATANGHSRTGRGRGAAETFTAGD
jgi:hypothetical protein